MSEFIPVSKRTSAIFFLAVAAATFAACVLFLKISPPAPPSADAFEYYTLASNIAAGRGFSTDGQRPAIVKPPLFSILLGFWFYLTGGPSVYSASLFQGLMHSLACATAFLLFMEIFAALRLALFLTFWLALIPPHLSRIGHILQEPTITFFTTLSVLLSLKLMRAASPGTAVCAGIAWGLCTLSKVVSWFGPFLLALSRAKAGRLYLSRKQTILLIFFFLATLTPWTLRNYGHFHRVIIVNAQGVVALEWHLTGPYKKALFAEDSDISAGKRLIEEMNAKGFSESQKEKSILIFMKRNIKYYFFGRIISGSVYFTFPDFFQNWYYTTALSPPQRFWKAAAYAWWLLLTLPLYAALFYLCLRLKRDELDKPVGFLVVFYLLYWAQYAVIAGDPRYSVPVYPILLCFLPAALKLISAGK